MPEIKLSVATHRINALTLLPVTYNRMFLAVLSGAIPVVRRGGRWWMDEADIPAAAAYFAQHPAGRTRRQSKDAA